MDCLLVFEEVILITFFDVAGFLLSLICSRCISFCVMWTTVYAHEQAYEMDIEDKSWDLRHDTYATHVCLGNLAVRRGSNICSEADPPKKVWRYSCFFPDHPCLTAASVTHASLFLRSMVVLTQWEVRFIQSQIRVTV